MKRSFIFAGLLLLACLQALPASDEPSQALLALHRAAGEKVYLDKAAAAANAIGAQQFADGSISNWGTRWLENGVPKGESCGHNWYNTGAIASASLDMLNDYRAEVR